MMKPVIVIFFILALFGTKVNLETPYKHYSSSKGLIASGVNKFHQEISQKSRKTEKPPTRGSSAISNIGTSSMFRRIESELNISEDAHLPITKLVPKYGYPLEVHEVVTEDGYILTMHRIPHGRNSKSQKRKRPLLVIHGLLCSADDWIVLGPEKSLGYVFADADYDVWLGNVRGTKHSRSHIRLSPNNLNFWQFHIDEIGLYDVPAMIDYILKETGEEQLYYIGYSQGTTSFFMMCSARPEYNKKVKIMTSLAPVSVNWHNISPVLQFLFTQNRIINNIIYAFTGTLEFLPLGDLMNAVGELACNDRALTQRLCANLYFLSGGYDWQQLNKTMLPIIFGHFPSSCSVGQFAQFDQIQKSSKLTHFNYGAIKNIQIYGTSQAPTYNISKIIVPVFLMYGRNDWAAYPKDIKFFHKKLRNKVGVYYVKHANFTHLDFMWANDVKQLVYDVVIRKMKNY